MSDNTPELRGITLRSMRMAVEFVKHLTVRNGKLLRSGNRFTLECGGGGGSFNGMAYTPAGRLYEDLTDTTKLYVKYDLSTGIITEEVGPPAEPWGVNETWRKKSDFSGSIYF
jgi:hypothetical protein